VEEGIIKDGKEDGKEKYGVNGIFCQVEREKESRSKRDQHERSGA
jgi:hypothetical protein